MIAPGERVCLFVALPRAGELLPHSVDHIAAWQAAGYRTIVVVAVGSLDEAVDLSPLDAAEGVAIRVNRGYDFGAWAAAIRSLGKPLRDASVLALANDSVLGPSHGFGTMLERAERSDADLVGLVENQQVRRHFQSFLLFFKPPALQASVFRRFWYGVRSGDRNYVIEFYETSLLATFTRAGLRAEVLFPVPGGDYANSTLTDWRRLIDAGFPYIKVQLFRDNPFGAPIDGWRLAAEDGGFDVARLEEQIAALKRHGSHRWQV